ncbi:MAG: hypothetical protein LUE27_05350 [Clostridia bacterium]|nr:hypothetical protein [Clostridia bacterium]
MSELEQITEEIFPLRDYDARSDDEHFLAEQKGKTCIDKYGWEAVFPVWRDYLYNKCTTRDDVYGFICVLDSLTFFDFDRMTSSFGYHIENPYGFLGYIYYRLGTPIDGQAMCIMDVLSPEILIHSAGRKDLDTMYNSRYIPEKDPLIIEAVDKWKQKLG